MALLGRKLAVSIPDTVLEEKDSLREKTAKLGLIARACAIYGVDLVEVFTEPGGRGEAEGIVKVLKYLETPQYLRKRLFPLDDALSYAGALPPLRIPSHKPKVPLGKVSLGEFREGVVNRDGSVDVGLDVQPSLDQRSVPGKRVTVRFVSISPPRVELARKSNAPEYWGYEVEVARIDRVLEDTRFPMKIATSRLGTPVSEVMIRLQEAFGGAKGVKLVFGSPSRGLYDMYGKNLSSKVSFVVNLFPNQQVETVRTEEAIFAGLGLVSLITAQKA